MAAAVLITGAGWALALHKQPAMALVAGSIVGGGVAAMHYLGMSAVHLGGYVRWDRDLVAASLVLGIGLAAAAVWLQRVRPRALPWGATLLLTGAICGLHFTAMAAVTIYPISGSVMPVRVMDSRVLAMIVTAAILVILFAGLGLIHFNLRLARRRTIEAEEKAGLADQIVRGAAERDVLTTELERQLEINGAALNNIIQGLSMYNEHGHLITHNRRFAEMFGLPGRLLVEGTPYQQIVEHLKANGIVPRVLEATDGRRPNAAVAGMELLDGRIIHIRRQLLPQGGWVTTHEDVTEMQRANQKIAHLATHDLLTELPNRVAFTDKLRSAAAAAQHGHCFAVHSIDLDRFKEVNDTLGHPIGDAILKQAAARLTQLTKAGDFVTRVGGDEFVILQNAVEDPAIAATFADEIIANLSEPYGFDGHTVVIGASIGISLAPADGSDPDDLLKKSDLALYRAKEESRGTFCFFKSGMDSRLEERRQIETDLRIAIQEGQFVVHYQPLLDVAHGTVQCFEALVRWQHPTRGLVAPNDFIGVAEETGLIIPIGEWVLRQACRDAVTWPEDIKVAVNLSPAQFKRGDLVAMTTNALFAAGLAPGRLDLEITESVLLHDETWVQSVLNQLIVLGVGIAMDDFGTGYSSLSYLRSFPFTKIKIDGSFIADLGGQTDALAIIQATIQLSKRLGMETTAEGVETMEQLAILTAEGCTQAQGFHISPPIPGSEIPKLLKAFGKNGSPPLRAAS